MSAIEVLDSQGRMEHQHKLTDRVKGVSALFILGLILHTARRHGNGR